VLQISILAYTALSPTLDRSLIIICVFHSHTVVADEGREIWATSMAKLILMAIITAVLLVGAMSISQRHDRTHLMCSFSLPLCLSKKLQRRRRQRKILKKILREHFNRKLHNNFLHLS
jgi:hypothetical protein